MKKNVQKMPGTLYLQENICKAHKINKDNPKVILSHSFI